jgi:hypothetical protein
MKDISTYGSDVVSAVKMDTTGLFVEKSGTKLMEVAYNIDVQDYATRDLNILSPDLHEGNAITKLVVQRQPDTRIHCIRADGTVAVFLYEKPSEVMCWYTYSTDGTVEDAFVLPGDDEDQVYYIINRTIDGNTKRYYEKFAKESECEGGTLSRNLDCFIEISQGSSTTISGLSHLEAETVYVWANGKNLGSYTVSSGSITVSEAVTSAIVGKSYTGQYKSAKLAYAAAGGTAIEQRKIINKIGLVLYKTHHQGISYGRDFNNLQTLPQVIKSQTIAADTIHDSLDFDMTEFGGDWDTDSRICLQATAPNPCTVVNAVFAITTNETA